MVSRTHTAKLAEFLCIKALGLEASESWGAPSVMRHSMHCVKGIARLSLQYILFVPLIKGDMPLVIQVTTLVFSEELPESQTVTTRIYG